MSITDKISFAELAAATVPKILATQMPANKSAVDVAESQVTHHVKDNEKKDEKKNEKKDLQQTEFKPNKEELAWQECVQDILENGEPAMDRTQVGTLGVFGRMLRYSLADNQWPLLTTRELAKKSIVLELLWMLSGHTDSKLLSQQGVKIWDANGTREFLDKQGLHKRPVGDLGPVYGFQWRHFGAKYVDCKTNYDGQGQDQIAQLVHDIKTNPTSRRHILSAWNPSDLKAMALPPCHMLAQFHVHGQKTNGQKAKLSCLLTQRSCDMGLGVPFNIASYALLTILLAHICGLEPGELVHSMGNCHVYVTHKEALMEQVLRTPKPFPKLKIKCAPKAMPHLYRWEDLEISEYHPHKPIAMKMAV